MVCGHSISALLSNYIFFLSQMFMPPAAADISPIHSLLPFLQPSAIYYPFPLPPFQELRNSERSLPITELNFRRSRVLITNLRVHRSLFSMATITRVRYPSYQRPSNIGKKGFPPPGDRVPLRFLPERNYLVFSPTSVIHAVSLGARGLAQHPYIRSQSFPNKSSLPKDRGAENDTGPPSAGGVQEVIIPIGYP